MVNSEIGSEHITKGSKKKGKAKRTTLNFNEFVKLTSGPGPLPNIPLRKAKVDDEISDDVCESDRNAISNIVLPTAPKSSCNIDINDPRLPSNPPYIIYVSNLPYDFEDEELNAFFENISVMNIPRDDSRKSKGCAYIELGAKENLVSALNLPEIVMRGRRLRIELVNDNSQKRRFDSHSSDNHRISESMFSDWRSESRSDSSNDSYRKNFSRSNKSDHTDVVDTVDSVSNWRNSSNGIFQTKRHTTDIANTDLRTNKMENHNQNNKLTKERPKLLLCPRSKPLSVSSSSSGETSFEKKSSIFGNAKPVDTAARERQIENQLLQTRQRTVIKVQQIDDKDEVEKTNGSNSNIVHNVDAKQVYKPPRMRQRDNEVDLNMNGKPPMNENKIDNGESNYGMMNGEKSRVQLKKSNTDDIKNLNINGKINFIDTNKFACLGDDISDE